MLVYGGILGSYYGNSIYAILSNGNHKNIRRTLRFSLVSLRNISQHNVCFCTIIFTAYLCFRPQLLWEGFENRKTYPKLCLIRAFTYFRLGVRDRVRLSTVDHLMQVSDWMRPPAPGRRSSPVFPPALSKVANHKTLRGVSTCK